MTKRYLKPFTQLKRAAKGVLTTNTNDLFVWDNRFLTSPTAPICFVWLLRESGTHLFPLYDSVDNNPVQERRTVNQVTVFDNISQTYGQESFRCFIFNDHKLTPATWGECRSKLIPD